MTDMTDDKVKALLDGATPGRRVQFHGSYCPEAVGTPFTDWDTSHDVSVIRPDGSRYRLAHYKHASDAYLSQMAPVLARALLDARAELAAAQQREAGLVERAEKAEAERDRIDQWRETAIVERDTYSEERDAAEGRVAALTEALGDMVGLFSADNVLRKGTHVNATLKLARAALAQTPTEPGDGWTWNERLGWIGPDGKPAGRGK